MSELLEGYMALSAFIASGYFLGRFIIRKVKHNMALNAVVEKTDEFDRKYSHLFNAHNIKESDSKTNERKPPAPKED